MKLAKNKIILSKYNQTRNKYNNCMQSINLPQDQLNSYKLQALKLKNLAQSIEQQSFHDNSLFFDKKNLFTLINPNPHRKIKNIYDKIIVSNKNDPLHPSSYRKYQSNRNRYQNKTSIYQQKQNTIIKKINFQNLQLIDSARDFNDSKIILKSLSKQQQNTQKDRKKFFKNLLLKFSQNVQEDNSVHYKQRIHLFKKIFQHYKIKPEEKQHFSQLIRKVTQKQAAQLNTDTKISTKINLQSRRNNWSVNQKRSNSPHQAKFRLKQKGLKTASQKRTIKQRSNLSEILTIQSKTQKDDIFKQLKNNSIMLTNNNGQRLSIQQMQKQVNARKFIINNKVQKISKQFQQDIKQIFGTTNSHSVNRSKNYQKKIQLNLQQLNKTQTPIDIKLSKFRQFLFAVNFGNNLFIPLEVDKYPTTFKIYVGKGNNSNLIKSIFKKRFWFQVTKNIEEANIVWTQLKQQAIFQKQKPKQYLLLSQQKQQTKQNQVQYQKQNQEINSPINLMQANPQNFQVNPQNQINMSGIRQSKNKSNINYKSTINSCCLVRFDDGKSSIQLSQQNQSTLNIQGKSKKQQSGRHIGSIQPVNSIKNSKLKNLKIVSYQQTVNKIKKHPQMLLFKNLNLTSHFVNNPLYRILSQQQLSQYEKLYLPKHASNVFIGKPGAKMPNFNERKNDVLMSNINSAAVRQEEKNGLVMHNHLPFNGILGNKKAMFYILKQYCETIKINLFEIVPLTFHIKQGLKDQQYKKFVETFQFRRKNKIINYWVMKPGQFSNRGNGIQCTNKIQQIRKRVQVCGNKIDPKKMRKNLGPKSVILQSYITNPLLYNGRKFDIRTYMMVTIVNGKIKAYWYEQGYIRTSSYIWNLSQIQDRQIHLTNDAVQKYSQTYGKYEPGNKLSYRDIQRYLQTYEKAGKNMFHQKIVPQMKQIAAISLKASYLFLDPHKLQNNFQIFGFDFMLDSKMKPWLIQINTNPCLELGCPILERIIPNMLQNAFRIAIDPLFPPPSTFSSNYKYNIAENASNYNKFHLIFDEAREGPAIRKIYQSKNLNEIIAKIEDIQQDKQTFQQDGEQIDLQGVKE